jgi:hypothetical protein
MRIARPPASYRDGAFLASCSESDAIEWLEVRPMRLSSIMGTPETPKDSHILEYILFRRRLSAIDLALAQYGRSGTILYRLYRRASDSIRVVACSNASLFVGETFGNYYRRESLIWSIMFNGRIPEIRALCENPHISSGVYTAIIECWKPVADREANKTYLPEDRYIAVLNFLSLNPRLPQSREESAERYYLDGFADYEYNKFYTSAWKLAETAPVTPTWSNALANLFKNLHVPFKCIEDVDAVIDRWRQAEEDNFAPTRYVREALAAAFLEPTVERLNDQDASIRNAFYQKFDPDRTEFRELDWNEWIDRDPEIYFSISNNEKVWASPLGRSKLKAMLWHGSKKDSDLLMVGFYNERIDELQAEHPDWFIDEEYDDYEEPIPDPIAQLRNEIRSVIFTMDKGRKSGLWIAGALIAGIIIGALIL